jgi:hypothetical protein
MNARRISFLLPVCMLLVMGCSDESGNPVEIELDTYWLITWTQYGQGWSQSVRADARGGFRDGSFRIETDTVWTSGSTTYPTNMKIILTGTQAQDSTYSGHIRIIESANGTDDGGAIEVTFSADRKRFVTEVIERRLENNELLASYYFQGAEK